MSELPFIEKTIVMSSAATGNSDAFQIGGKGPLRIRVTLGDATSADGDFFVLLSDRQGGTFLVRGALDADDQVTLTKTAGAALSDELVIQKPAATWAKVRYDRDSGGAASEITAVVQSWE